MPCPYLAVDLETTGLDAETCQIIELAAVVETDWVTPVEQLPTLHVLVEHHEYHGQAGAISLNQRVFAELAKPHPDRAIRTVHADRLTNTIGQFVGKHFTDTPTLAGKNVGTFDLAFLRKLPRWKHHFRHKHRVIDPGMLYFNPLTDAAVPSTDECLKRAGLVNEQPHNPVHDCWAVIRLVRVAYENRLSKTQAAAILDAMPAIRTQE